MYITMWMDDIVCGEIADANVDVMLQTDKGGMQWTWLAIKILFRSVNGFAIFTCYSFTFISYDRCEDFE